MRKIRGEYNLYQFNVANFFRCTRERERKREINEARFKRNSCSRWARKTGLQIRGPAYPLFWAHPRRGRASRKKKTPCGSRPVLPDRWRPFANISQKGNDREAWLTRPVTPTRLITCIDAVQRRDYKTGRGLIEVRGRITRAYALGSAIDTTFPVIVVRFRESLRHVKRRWFAFPIYLSRHFSIFPDCDGVFLFSCRLISN